MYDYLAKIILLGPSGSGKCVTTFSLRVPSARQAELRSPTRSLESRNSTPADVFLSLGPL